jgi:signal transduction histidine kinase
VTRTIPRYGRPVTGGRRIRAMKGEVKPGGMPEPAGFSEYLAGRAKWIALAVFTAVTATGTVRLNPDAPVAVTGAVLAVGAATLLVLRWRPQLLHAAVATAGIAMLGAGSSSNIGWFAVVLIAAWCALTGARRDGLAYWAATMILFGAEWSAVKPDPGWGAWLAGVTLTIVFSLLVRHERDLLGQLRRAQAGLAEQARTQERDRIARELHDIIGHTLTVSLLHVQSARLAVEHDPADAARALAEAERLGRECLAEVRTTAGMLRQDDQAGSTAPLPGVGDLPALVERFRSAGADITFTAEGGTGALPATAGLALYRIAQEALTNAVKHAPGSPTEVRLTVAPGEVTLTADSRAAPGTGTGLGVVSMRERAESVGGACEAGPGGQGWLVRARLPLNGGPS